MKSPKIRFKEFQNEWNSRILGDICEIKRGERVTKQELLSNGKFPVISGGVSPMGFLDKFNRQANTITIAQYGTAGYVNFQKNNFWANDICYSIFSKSKTNNLFLYYSLKNLQKYIYTLVNRAVPEHLPQERLSKLEFRIPNDIKEQEAIGEFFRKIDGILDLENSRFKKLENFKKTMLDKLFVKDGADEPQIRLGSFKGKWNSKILGDICDVRDGTHESPQYITKGMPLVTSKNVKNGSLDFSDINYISKDDYLKINERSKVDINDILMGMIGTIGNLALITEEPNYSIKNVALIKNIKKVNHLFLYSQLQSNFIFRQLESLSEGGTQKFIALNRIRNLEFRIPNDIKEQEAIGEFFRKIDGILEFSQKKIAKLENIKKYLLNKMFV